MGKIRNNITVYQYSLSICMGSFVLGYQLTDMTTINHLIVSQNGINPEDSWKTMVLINGVTALFAIFGVLLFRPLTNLQGYLNTFRLFDILTIIGSIIGIISLSISVQLVSRAILGLVIGMNTILIPIYLTSIIPGAMGGPAGTLNQVFITIGILFGSLMGYLVVDTENSQIGYKIIIGLPILPSIIRLYTTIAVFPYETVENMIKNNDNQSLQKYVNLIYQSMTIQQYKISKKLPEQDIISEQTSFFDARSQPYLRRLFMASSIALLNQFCGMGALGIYGTSVFGAVVGKSEESILTVFVYLYAVQVIVSFISSRYLEEYGRRAFMATGQKIIIVCLFLIGILDIFAPNLHVILLILIFTHMIGFSICYGPCTFLIGTQILHDATIPGLILWSGIFTINFLNIGFISSIGVGLLCLIYCFIEVIGYIYVSSYLVQTQGTPRSEVYAGFRKQCVNKVTRNPLVIHRNYQGCQNQQQIKFTYKKKSQEQF